MIKNRKNRKNRKKINKDKGINRFFYLITTLNKK